MATSDNARTTQKISTGVGSAAASTAGAVSAGLLGTAAASSSVPVVGWVVAAIAAIGAGVAGGIARKQEREGYVESEQARIGELQDERKQFRQDVNVAQENASEQLDFAERKENYSQQAGLRDFNIQQRDAEKALDQQQVDYGISSLRQDQARQLSQPRGTYGL